MRLYQQLANDKLLFTNHIRFIFVPFKRLIKSRFSKTDDSYKCNYRSHQQRISQGVNNQHYDNPLLG